MSDDAVPDTGAAKTPADFLKSIRGKPVVVKLNSGVDYRGILACLDGYMNIAMEQTEVSASHVHPAAEGLTDASDAIERRVGRVERWHPRLDCAPAS
jgi:small nuclear ribonucleoprotein (snRNP)-like protein